VTKRRNTMSAPRALDPTRARRASQAAAVGQVAGRGQAIDPSGRIIPVDGAETTRDADGVPHINLGFLLHNPTGSPRRVAVDRDALIDFLLGWASQVDLGQAVDSLTTLACDLDGGEAATWLTPDVSTTATLLEPWAEFDGGEA
jgi:hypothetical protein